MGRHILTQQTLSGCRIPPTFEIAYGVIRGAGRVKVNVER